MILKKREKMLKFENLFFYSYLSLRLLKRMISNELGKQYIDRRHTYSLKNLVKLFKYGTSFIYVEKIYINKLFTLFYTTFFSL